MSDDHYIIPEILPTRPMPIQVPLVTYVGEKGRQIIGEAIIRTDGTVMMTLNTEGSRILSTEYSRGDFNIGFITKSPDAIFNPKKTPTPAKFMVPKSLLEDVEPPMIPRVADLIEKESWERFNDDPTQA